MSGERKISVIIPAYNDGEQLKQTLTRLHEIREREYENIEIVVAVRASNDDTEAVANRLADVVVPGGKVTQARNQGARAASGEIFVFLDADAKPGFHVFPKIAEVVNEKTAGTCPAVPSLNTRKARFAVGLANLARRTKLIRGMTNLFFCHRTLFIDSGIEYDEERNIGEFSEHIWRARREVGARYTFLDIPDCYEFSVDRWERVGYLRTFLFWVKFVFIVYVLRGDSKRLEEQYWSQ